MCISPRYFQGVSREYGILPLLLKKKKVYRKTDLIAAIERGSINPTLPH